MTLLLLKQSFIESLLEDNQARSHLYALRYSLTMLVLGLALYSPRAASTRHRLIQYKEGLQKAGITLEVHYLLSDQYLECRYNQSALPYWDMLKSGLGRLRLLLRQKRYDGAILYGELFPMLPATVENRLLRIPYIYDFDDAFFLKYRQSDSKILRRLLGNKIDSLIRKASAVTAGNEYLADYSRQLNTNSTVLPTVIDETRYKYARSTTSDVFTVGWIGSPSTRVYLDQVVESLSVIGKEAPTRLIVVGATQEPIPNVTVTNLPWSEDTEVGIIGSFDVGIMPLPDSEWAKGKCAFKLIQYMACGIPSIASPVGANLSVLGPDCGIFANDAEEWIAAFRIIRDSKSLRDTLAKNARERALRYFVISENAPRLEKAILALVESDRASRKSSDVKR